MSGKQSLVFRPFYRSAFKTSHQLAAHFDHVEQRTIRSLESKIGLLAAVAPAVTRPILRYAMDGCGAIPRRDEGTIKSKLRSKGIPNSQVGEFRAAALWEFLSPPASTATPTFTLSADYVAVPRQSSAKQLFMHDSELERIWRASVHLREDNQVALKAMDLSPMQLEKARNSFHAGFNCVNKSTKCTCKQIKSTHHLQRLIVDARMANCHLQNPAPMEIFTLEALFSCFGRCKDIATQHSENYSKYGTTDNGAIDRIISASQKKFPSTLSSSSSSSPSSATTTREPKQFPIYTISADLRHFYHQIPLPRELRHYMAINLGKRGVVFPTTWPMGASPAAGIAQAITWSLLLAGLEKDVTLRRSLGLHWEGEELPAILPWFPLYDKSGSFCGGIFVLIDNIFVMTTDRVLASKWSDRITQNAQNFNAELKGGVERVNLLPGSAPAPSPDSPPLSSSSPPAVSSESSVEFSGIKFTWSGRSVKGPIELDEQLARPSSTSWSGSYRNLASILGQCLWHYRVHGDKLYRLVDYRALSKVAYPRQDRSETWNSTTTISGTDFDHLRSMYEACRSTTRVTPHAALRPCGSYALLATDASYSDANGARIGYVFEVYDVAGNLLGRHTFSSLPCMDDSQIAFEELRAVVKATADLRRLYGVNMPDLILLGIDSTHVKGMISHNLARTDTACALLDQLYSALGSSRLYLLYVKSELNPADACTRDDVDWEESLWSDLKSRMRTLLPVATERFEKFGKVVEAAPNQTARRDRE